MAGTIRQEGVDALLSRVRKELVDNEIVAHRDDVLADRPSTVWQAVAFVGHSVGVADAGVCGAGGARGGGAAGGGDEAVDEVARS